MFPLGHLHPFPFSLELLATEIYPARTVEIRVGFSNHTFTRDPVAGDLPHQMYGTRVFCRRRYTLSAQLPEIVRNIGGKKCYYAKRENYMIIETPGGQEYSIFFDVRSTGEPNAVLLYVQSAYPRDGYPNPHGRSGKKVGFKVLVNHALLGTRPSPPP